MNIQIRPLQRHDRTEWGALWRQYLEFYETELPESVYDSSFERMLGDSPHDFNALVAVKGARLVGLAHFLFHRHGWRIENVCYLQDLFVSPDCRGDGAGRALIEAVYAQADQNGAPSVYWMTNDSNVKARRLYDRIGQVTSFIKYTR